MDRFTKVYFSDGSIVGGGGSTKSSPGEHEFHPEDACKVDPINQRRRNKHRGRICRLKGTYRDYKDVSGKSSTIKVAVKFLDDGRSGYVDAEDLVPATLEEIEAQPFQE